MTSIPFHKRVCIVSISESHKLFLKLGTNQLCTLNCFLYQQSGSSKIVISIEFFKDVNGCAKNHGQTSKVYSYTQNLEQ